MGKSWTLLIVTPVMMATSLYLFPTTAQQIYDSRKTNNTDCLHTKAKGLYSTSSTQDLAVHVDWSRSFPLIRGDFDELSDIQNQPLSMLPHDLILRMTYLIPRKLVIRILASSAIFPLLGHCKDSKHYCFKLCFPRVETPSSSSMMQDLFGHFGLLILLRSYRRPGTSNVRELLPL